VLVVAATMAANLAAGRPLWLLVVAPASSGKAEIAGTVRDLPYVHVVSELTKSALLSGTGNRDRSSDATGGLMRQVGEFGVLLAKDFTSVLTQNKDARGEALSALREIDRLALGRPRPPGHPDHPQQHRLLDRAGWRIRVRRWSCSNGYCLKCSGCDRAAEAYKVA
jgi:hypothetical protein